MALQVWYHQFLVCWVSVTRVLPILPLNKTGFTYTDGIFYCVGMEKMY